MPETGEYSHPGAEEHQEKIGNKNTENAEAGGELSAALKMAVTKIEKKEKGKNILEKAKDKFKEDAEAEEEKKQEAIIKKIKAGVIKCDFDRVKKIQEENNISDEKCQRIIRKEFIDQVAYGSIGNAKTIRKEFTIPKEYQKQVIKEDLVRSFRSGYADSGKKNITEEDIKKDFLLSEKQFEEALVEGLSIMARHNEVKRVKEVIEEFKVSSDQEQKALVKGFYDILRFGDVERALKNEKVFSLEEKYPVQMDHAVLDGLSDNMRFGYLDSIKKIKNSFNIKKEQFEKVITEGFIYNLEYGKVSSAKEIKEVSGIQNKEMQEAVAKKIGDFVLGDRLKEVKMILDKFEISKEMAQCAIKKGFAYYLKFGYMDKAKKVLLEFNISGEEVREILKEKLIDSIKNNYSDKTRDFVRDFFVFQEIIKDEDIKKISTDLFIRRMQYDAEEAGYIKQDFGISDEVINSDEMQKVIMSALDFDLRNGYNDNAKKIQEEFNIPLEKCQKIVKEKLFDNIESGNLAKTKDALEKFFTPEEIKSDYFNQIILKSIFKNIRWNILSRVNEIQKAFSLPENFSKLPEVREKAKEEIIAILEGTHPQRDEAMRIKEYFSLEENRIIDEYIESIVSMGAKTDKIVEEMSKIALLKQELGFSLVPEKLLKIKLVEDFLDEIGKISPTFYKQAKRSSEILLLIGNVLKEKEKFIKSAEDNPFLLEAVIQNPRFGSKLLLSYAGFNESSQEDIKFLFQNKAEIMKIDPDIDPESHEFRIAMQERLLRFKNNAEILIEVEFADIDAALLQKVKKEILEDDPDFDRKSPEFRKAIGKKLREYEGSVENNGEVRKTGIDPEQWLNYDKVEIFSLGEDKESTKFSNIIATPLGRVQDTIDQYLKKIDQELKNNKESLLKYELPVKKYTDDLEKLNKLKLELAKAIEDKKEDKARTIGKNIDAIAKKLEKTPKSISLWNTLQNELKALDVLKADIAKANDSLIDADKYFTELLINKNKALKGRTSEKKKQLNKSKADMKEKLSLLNDGIENLKKNLAVMIAPALGEEVSKKIASKIENDLGEQLMHYDLDKSALENIFSDGSEEDRKRIKGNAMSIFVCPRNPDVDLYQGNTSPCCISIESGCAINEQESTIAQYNTDLGMQIVNIYDEVKKEPVTAAWCWLGKSEKGETALVVDNIEANTNYSNVFPEQMTNKLFAYLKEYARAIGVKKLVIGKMNNDLPIKARLDEMNDSSKYKKIGGYNELDEYYLEASDTEGKEIE